MDSLPGGGIQCASGSKNAQRRGAKSRKIFNKLRRRAIDLYKIHQMKSLSKVGTGGIVTERIVQLGACKPASNLRIVN